MKQENFVQTEESINRYKENITSLTQDFELGLFLYLINKIKWVLVTILIIFLFGSRIYLRYKPEIYKIDLSTIEGIKSGNMVLQSHDIIYVTPNPNYALEILSDIGPVLSLISTLTLTWVTYMNLIQ